MKETIDQVRRLLDDLESQMPSEDAQNEENIEAEVDFYNVRENRIKIYERDNYVCQHCRKQLTRFSATLDHLQPVSEGGRIRPWAIS